jgi:hypothetical protein
MTAISAIMMGPISRRHLVRGPLIAGAAASLAGAAGVLFLTTGTPVIWIVAVTCSSGSPWARPPAGTRHPVYASRRRSARHRLGPVPYLRLHRLLGHHQHRFPQER